MKKIAFIIINYNNIPDTLDCLESFKEIDNQDKYDFTIYLIDNHSENPINDNHLFGFSLKAKTIIFPQNQNFGFAEGNNIGIREAQKVGYDYYVLLNNDTVLVDDSVERMICYMDTHTDVGIGGLVNYYFSAPNMIWQAGARFLTRRFDYRQVRVTDSSSDLFTEVDYVPGSSFFIRKEVIDKIGVLDSNYFAYREEADYCWRAKLAGYKVGFLPNTRILHKVGKSSTSLIKQYLRSRNELYFCSKFGNKVDFLLVYTRIFKRTIQLWFHTHYNYRVLRTTIMAITDYHKGKVGKGSIDNVR